MHPVNEGTQYVLGAIWSTISNIGLPEFFFTRMLAFAIKDYIFLLQRRTTSIVVTATFNNYQLSIPAPSAKEVGVSGVIL